MKFKTTLEVKPKQEQIKLDYEIVLLGSCFSNHIAQKLKSRKYKILSNPFGTIFNPISLFQILFDFFNKKNYKKADFERNNQLFFSFNHSHIYKNNNINDLISQINQQNIIGHNSIKEAKFIFLTFGTSWVFENKNKIVANCHKLPQNLFLKRLLTVEEILEGFENIYKKIKILNPNIQIVLTVSPVRHIKNGLVENNLSKSILILAVHKLVSRFQNVHYYPSYELLIDDLRDYRFFKEDLIHPTKMAIDYVWEHFEKTYFSKETKEIHKKLHKIDVKLNHKSSNSESEEHQIFIHNLIKEMSQIEAKYPHISFAKEKLKLRI